MTRRTREQEIRPLRAARTRLPDQLIAYCVPCGKRAYPSREEAAAALAAIRAQRPEHLNQPVKLYRCLYAQWHWGRE